MPYSATYAASQAADAVFPGAVRGPGAVHAAEAGSAYGLDQSQPFGGVAERELVAEAVVDRLADHDPRRRLEGDHH